MIKEYHVSKNLFDGTLLSGYFTNADFDTSGDESVYKSIKVYLIAGTYTFSWGKNVNSVRLIVDGNYSQPAYNNISTQTITSTTDGYIGISFRDTTSSSTAWDNTTPIMLNTGQIALPYEPYGNTWNTKSYCKATTGSETYSNFPIVVRSREQSIPSWNMKGNEQHTGTASPTSPIEINGTGDRTANLYFKSLANCSIDATGKLTGNSQFVCYVAKVEANKTYIGEKGYVYAFFDTEPVSGSQSYNSQRVTENARDGITSPINGYVVVRFNTGTTDAMLSEGTTILPYEPYGYKIPISANGTALTPVYLTEQLMEIGDYVDSLASSGAATRNTGELILTGDEEWSLLGRDTGRTVFSIALTEGSTVCMCTHIEYKATYTTELNRIVIPNAKNALYISIDNTVISSGTPLVTDFKTWLAEQYAAGTPVTVYYVLATPTTEQVTVPTIPTTSSPATIDVNTSVKPSEMSLTYDGYKICKKQKYQNDAWT